MLLYILVFHQYHVSRSENTCPLPNQRRRVHTMNHTKNIRYNFLAGDSKFRLERLHGHDLTTCVMTTFSSMIWLTEFLLLFFPMTSDASFQRAFSVRGWASTLFDVKWPRNYLSLVLLEQGPIHSPQQIRQRACCDQFSSSSHHCRNVVQHVFHLWK